MPTVVHPRRPGQPHAGKRLSRKHIPSGQGLLEGVEGSEGPAGSGEGTGSSLAGGELTPRGWFAQNRSTVFIWLLGFTDLPRSRAAPTWGGPPRSPRSVEVRAQVR